MLKIVRTYIFLTIFFLCAFFARSAFAAFYIQTTPNPGWMGIWFGATGTFTIDWGDGTVETIVSNPGKGQKVQASHNYPNNNKNPVQYTISLDGLATAYDYNKGANWASNYNAVLTFYCSNGGKLSSISGNLGHIFPTLSDGSQPVFIETFKGCSNLTGTIPSGIFDGISGSAENNMFKDTFNGDKNVSGDATEIFKDITGTDDNTAFNGTFDNTVIATIQCPTGTVQKGINEVTGWVICRPDETVFTATVNIDNFDKTFSFEINTAGNFVIDCGNGESATTQNYNTSGTHVITCEYQTSGQYNIVINGQATTNANPAISFQNNLKLIKLSGSLGKVFATVPGGQQGFQNTFSGCLNLSGPLPENLFEGVKGDAISNMFAGTFANCAKLTGYIPKQLLAQITGGDANVYSGMFTGATLMDKQCPTGTMSAGVGNDQRIIDGVAVCRNCTDEDPCPVCDAGFQKLKTSTGVAVQLYSDKSLVTRPALHVKSPTGQICYGNLILGDLSGSINVQYNGETYHSSN
ncbi:MAG: hypothetical protein MJ187_00410 [Alphaproteobacteria bacterium]|nr:hypothetical protein [Alphaproteobacteria bacterium]